MRYAESVHASVRGRAVPANGSRRRVRRTCIQVDGEKHMTGSKIMNALLDEARTLLHGIPAVTVLRAVVEEDNHITGLADVALEIEGWTGSLHKHVMKVHCRFAGALSMSAAVGSSRPAITAFASRQRRLVKEAAALEPGRVTPWGFLDGRVGIMTVEHMTQDLHSLETIALEQGSATDARYEIGRSVYDVTDGDGNGGWLDHLVYGRRIMLHDDVALDDHRLFVARRVPETVAVTLEGRPLGDLIAAPPSLAKRRILSARIEDDELHPLLTVDMAPDRVPIGAHLDAMVARGELRP